MSWTYLPIEPILSAYAASDPTPLPEASRFRRALNRAQVTGRITVGAADDLCVNLLGRHPCEVYGLDWWTLDDESV